MQIIPEGGAPGGHTPPGRARTPRRAVVGCGPDVAPLTYLFIPHHHLPPEKNPHCSLSRVLELKPTDFDLFARSSLSETVSGDCCLVCDSTICPISFCNIPNFQFGMLYIGHHCISYFISFWLILEILSNSRTPERVGDFNYFHI